MTKPPSQSDGAMLHFQGLLGAGARLLNKTWLAANRAGMKECRLGAAAERKPCLASSPSSQP